MSVLQVGSCKLPIRRERRSPCHDEQATPRLPPWLVSALAVCAVLGGRVTPARAQAACAGSWAAGQVYTAGNPASESGTNFQANWWTLGEDPATHNGGPGSGQPWTSMGPCTTGTPPPPTPIVQVFQDCGFAGWSASFTATGNFSTADLVSRHGLDSDASSIKIAAGFKVTLFDGDQETGASVVLTAGDTTCFTASNINFNDRLSSLRIEADNGNTGGGGSARFAPYADISLGTGSQVAGNARAAGLKAITLAFLVDGGCTASWGGGLGNVASAMFPNGTSVKSAIDALVAQGTQVIISWGGAAGSIQSSCGTASQVQAMYQSVFNAYPNIAGQDFDIEGGINTTVVAQALQGLKAANPSKSISLTLPVLPTGLVAAGLAIVNACHAVGFHPDTINVMAMDYGSANDNGGNMLLSAQQAAQATRNQTGDMIGVTPMIGVNDTNTETFTLANASALATWAKGQSFINRLAFWSLARDNGGCAGQGFASATCSGVSQSTWQFASMFAPF
jgi:chitinase